MKPIVRIIIFFWLVGLFFPLQAQIWLSNQDIFDQAEEFFHAEEFVEALPLYHLLEKKNVQSPNISFKIGACYLNIRGKKERAIPYLEQACSAANSRFVNEMEGRYAPLKAYLLLGIAYRVNNELDKAIVKFEELKDSIQETDPEFVRVIDMHIKCCENARLLNAFPGEPRTEKLPGQINNSFSNYNPVLVDHDSLLYYMEERKFYDAIMMVRNTQNGWDKPTNLTPVIGSDGDHILVGASNSGDTLFLAFYEPMKAGEIYETHRTADGWTDIAPLNEHINTVYNETHASLSRDGKTLYFTSNRAGGFGGLDIYMSVLDDNNQWGEAVNLGSKINTPYNEETPIINADNEILYFSSQGHLSMGGYDVFYSTRMGENKWRTPVNMGAPVSTTDDDLFYYPLDEHVSGMMSRIEEGSDGYDIYRYNSMVFANSPRFSVRGKVPEVDTSNYNEYYVAIVEKGKSDTLSKAGLSPNGNYEVVLPAGDFDIVVLNEKKDLSTSSGITLSGDEPEIVLVAGESKVFNEIDSIQTGTEISIEQIAIDTFYLHDILYRFDKFELSADNQAYLGKIKNLLVAYPNLELRIEGYTDSMGPEAYNIYLSEKRAQLVRDFLVSKGVDVNRLTIKGLGEEGSVAINTNPDGSDNFTGRQYNRRVHFVAITTADGLVFIHKSNIPNNLLIK